MSAKPDEILLFRRMRLERGHPMGRRLFVDEVGAELGIHAKRVEYLLDKWSERGWWDYGISARTGWFTRDAPEDLAPDHGAIAPRTAPATSPATDERPEDSKHDR